MPSKRGFALKGEPRSVEFPPLTPQDFSNPLFDKVRPTLRRIPSSTGRGKEEVIEGVTFTDGYMEVGYTYTLRTGHLHIVDTGNRVLCNRYIRTAEDFSEAIKRIDRNARQRQRRGQQKERV